MTDTDTDYPQIPDAIAYAGLPGAGKSTAANLAREIVGGTTVSMGAIVKEQARRIGIETSHGIGAFADALRVDAGEGAVATLLIDRLEEGETEYDFPLHIDGLRSPVEAKVFEEYFGRGNFYVVYLQSVPDLRYMRAKKRGRDGEEDFTRDDFRERTRREADWGALDLEAEAHIRISNNAPLDFLKHQLENEFDMKFKLSTERQEEALRLKNSGE
jgi:dephospho-CoA kinase